MSSTGADFGTLSKNLIADDDDDVKDSDDITITNSTGTVTLDN
jgi:hypothetical protein